MNTSYTLQSMFKNGSIVVYIKKEKSGNIREDIVRCEEPTYHLSPSEAKERLYKQFIMNGE